MATAVVEKLWSEMLPGALRVALHAPFDNTPPPHHHRCRIQKENPNGFRETSFLQRDEARTLNQTRLDITICKVRRRDGFPLNTRRGAGPLARKWNAARVHACLCGM